MIASAGSAPSAGAADAPDNGAHPRHAASFHEVLSALNPLQYLPVIGTIYRAVTGDTIPEAVQRLGSLIASGLLGGPIGVVINLGVMAFEKATGIDFDQTGQALLRNTAIAATGVPHAATPRDAAVPAELAPEPVRKGWSPAELAAYGVTISKTGALSLADLQGSDVLNATELSRLRMATTAYARLAVSGT